MASYDDDIINQALRAARGAGSPADPWAAANARESAKGLSDKGQGYQSFYDAAGVPDTTTADILNRLEGEKLNEWRGQSLAQRVNSGVYSDDPAAYEESQGNPIFNAMGHVGEKISNYAGGQMQRAQEADARLSPITNYNEMVLNRAQKIASLATGMFGGGLESLSRWFNLKPDVSKGDILAPPGTGLPMQLGTVAVAKAAPHLFHDPHLAGTGHSLGANPHLNPSPEAQSALDVMQDLARRRVNRQTPFYGEDVGPKGRIADPVAEAERLGLQAGLPGKPTEEGFFNPASAALLQEGVQPKQTVRYYQKQMGSRGGKLPPGQWAQITKDLKPDDVIERDWLVRQIDQRSPDLKVQRFAGDGYEPDLQVRDQVMREDGQLEYSIEDRNTGDMFFVLEDKDAGNVYVQDPRGIPIDVNAPMNKQDRYAALGAVERWLLERNAEMRRGKPVDGSAQWQDYATDSPKLDNYTEAAVGYPKPSGKPGDVGVFRDTSHMTDTPNLEGWTRYQDATKDKTRVIEENQPQRYERMGDAGPQASPEQIARAKRELDEHYSSNNALAQEREDLLNEAFAGREALQRQYGGYSRNKQLQFLAEADDMSGFHPSHISQAAELWPIVKQFEDRANHLKSVYESAQKGIASSPYTHDVQAATGILNKQMLADAAHDNIDRIAWTPGDVQAERYNKLLMDVKGLAYDPATKTLTTYDAGGPHRTFPNVPPEKLAEYIGSDAADRLMSTKLGQYDEQIAALKAQEADAYARYREAVDAVKREDTEPGWAKVSETQNALNSIKQKRVNLETENSTHRLDFPSGMTLGGDGMRGFYGDGTPANPGIMGENLQGILRRVGQEDVGVTPYRVNDGVRPRVVDPEGIPPVDYPSVPLKPETREKIKRIGLPLYAKSDVQDAALRAALEAAGGDPVEAALNVARERAKSLGHLDTIFHHGTTHDIKPTKGFADPARDQRYEPSSYHGPAIYMSSSASDSAGNYAGHGPDLSSRIAQRAEQYEYDMQNADPKERAKYKRIANQIEKSGDYPDGADYYLSSGESLRLAYAKALSELTGKKVHTMDLRTNPTNPVLLNDFEGKRSTFFPMEQRRATVEKDGDGWVVKDYDGSVVERHETEGDAWDAADEITYGREHEGAAVKIAQKLRNIGLPETADKVYERALDGEGLYARELEDIVRKSDELWDGTGDFEHGPGPLLQEIYRALGHDAVIMPNAERTFPGMNIPRDTTHIALFDNRRVRRTDAKFDPKKVDSTNLLASDAIQSAEARAALHASDPVEEAMRVAKDVPGAIKGYHGAKEDYGMLKKGKVKSAITGNTLFSDNADQGARAGVRAGEQRVPESWMPLVDAYSKGGDEGLAKAIRQRVPDIDSAVKLWETTPELGQLAWDGRPLVQQIADAAKHMARAGDKGIEDAVLLADSAKSAGVRAMFDVDPLGYYSAALEAAKGLKQAKGTGEQMLRQIESTPGVKKAEISATGLDQFLAGKPSVTKQEIVDFLGENRVGLKESYYNTEHGNMLEERKLAAKYRERGMSPDQAAIMASRVMDKRTGRGGDPKWQQYSLDPSNPTYRETVLHLDNAPKRLAEIEAEMKALQPKVHDASVDKSKAAEYRDLRNQQEALLAEYKSLKAEHDAYTFKSGHWPEPNAIAHTRTAMYKDTSGKNVFLVDELQSDWAQKIRDEFELVKKKVAKLESQYAEAASAAKPMQQEILNEMYARRADANATDVPLLDWVRQNAPDLVKKQEDAGAEVARIGRELEAARSASPGRDEAKIADIRQRLADTESKQVDAFNSGVKFLEQHKPEHADLPQSAQGMSSILSQYVGLERQAGRGGETVSEALRLGEHIDDIERQKNLLKAELRTAEAATPGHPLVNTTDQWTTTALRRLIKQAVDDGADAIALTPGKVHVDRFGLEKHVREFVYHPGRKELTARLHNGRRSEVFENTPPEKLPEIVGKEVAEKLLAQPVKDDVLGKAHVLGGQDLRIGGEGMRYAYDTMYPKMLGKILSKIDPSIKMETRQILPSSAGMASDSMPMPFGWPKKEIDFTSFPITDKVREAVKGGQALFSKADDSAGVRAAVGAGEQGDVPRIDNPIRAYHGSPHDFDRFDMSKIGTGEGAQAYGHGLYFAENEGVAKSYRDALSTRAGSEDAAYMLSKHNGDKAAALAEAEKRLAEAKGNWPAMEAAVRELRGDQQPGKMYEVALHADPNDFLDWDKPLSQQSEKVQKLINDHPRMGPAIREWAAREDGNGAAVWRAADELTKNEARASEALKNAGIPGIRYLDQGSRAAGEGSSNYVVFDDKLVQIMRKYGLPFTAAGVAEAMVLQDKAEASESKQSKPKRAQGGRIGNNLDRAMAVAYDHLYDQQDADYFRDNGMTRFTPTPEFAPGSTFRDPLFVMPPQSQARNLTFDKMDMTDRDYLNYRMSPPASPPTVRVK